MYSLREAYEEAVSRNEISYVKDDFDFANEYTMEEHKTRLQIILNELDISNLYEAEAFFDGRNAQTIADFCLAAESFSPYNQPGTGWSNDPCIICIEFVSVDNFKKVCPCFIFGAKEALCRTIKKLKES